MIDRNKNPNHPQERAIFNVSDTSLYDSGSIQNYPITASGGVSETNEIATVPLTEEEEIYKENILDHYRHPHNRRELVHYTIKHREFNPLCGDEITVYVLLEADRIADVAFTGQDCAISQASISLLTDALKGVPIETARQLTEKDIFAMLGIPISHTRMKCALLSLKTVQGGLAQC